MSMYSHSQFVYVSMLHQYSSSSNQIKAENEEASAHTTDMYGLLLSKLGITACISMVFVHALANLDMLSVVLSISHIQALKCACTHAHLSIHLG